jgi:hypothetical protein
MQKDFQESVAISLDVRPYRVKIDNINVAAPHARRLLAHGCEVFFSVRVPDGDEVRAQLILAALTLERVNVQLEKKGLSASLNFVGAPRIARKPCEAGKYRVNADCDSCPSNSSSPAGSVGIQACLCNAVSANGERSREGGGGAGPSSPPSLHLSRTLSVSSLPSRRLLPASPMRSVWGRLSLDEVYVCLFRAQGYTVPSWQCTTIGGNALGNAPEGSACAYPFTYRGAVHYSCTTIDNYNVPWCSTNGVDCSVTNVVVDQCSWGNCNCTSGPCLACEAGELRRGIMSDMCASVCVCATSVCGHASECCAVNVCVHACVYARARACVHVYMRATSYFFTSRRERQHALTTLPSARWWTGTYKDAAGNASCSPCPSISSSPAGSVEIQACLCNAGYTGPNGGACVSCGAGTYKDAAGNASCSPCPGNSSSPAGSVEIQACLCNAGYTLNIGNCVACAAGRHSAATARACVCACEPHAHVQQACLFTSRREAARTYHSALRALVDRHIQRCGRQRLMPSLPQQLLLARRERRDPSVLV